MDRERQAAVKRNAIRLIVSADAEADPGENGFGCRTKRYGVRKLKGSGGFTV